MKEFIKSDTLDVADKNVAKRREVIIGLINGVVEEFDGSGVVFDINDIKGTIDQLDEDDTTGIVASKTKRGVLLTLENVSVEMVMSLQDSRNGWVGSYFCTCNKFMSSIDMKKSIAQIIFTGEIDDDDYITVHTCKMVDIMKLQPENIYRSHKAVHIKSVPTGKQRSVKQLKKSFRKYFSDFEVRANQRAINRSIKFATM